MIRFSCLVLLLTLTVAAGGVAQLPAQKGVPGKGSRPTAPPKGQQAVAEPSKAPATKLTPKQGGQPKVVAAIVDADYLIGIQGYPSQDGVVVVATVRRRDLNRGGQVRCPAAEIGVDFQGNGRLVRVRLEPGDKITALGGFQVKTLDELIVAVNSASDPHALEIAFIDWKSGNEYVGVIDAMKVK